MKVLGVHFGHESGACLVDNGRVIRHETEERYVKIKNAICTPYESFKYCLDNNDINDTMIAVSDSVVSSIRENYVALLHKSKFKYGIATYLEKKSYDIENEIMVNHHLCHAASSYYISGFDDTLIICLDGIGDDTTQWVGWGKEGKIKQIYRVSVDGFYVNEKKVRNNNKLNQFYSWGFFYGAATEALGWRICECEGKTMGLAPYGDPNVIPNSIMRSIIYDYKDMSFIRDLGVTHLHVGGVRQMSKMIDIYGRENFAASVQKHFEERILRFIKYWVGKTGAKRLCTAGGCFLNVKLNQRIFNEVGVDYFPTPLASDTGQSVGAALYAYHQFNPYIPKRIDNLYWGSEFTDEYIEEMLNRNKIKWEHYDTTNGKEYIAHKLAEGNIVGWFDGRMEAGPRALGHRSILMSPLKAENKDILNKFVKFRESFRPFCPSVTEDAYFRHFRGKGGDFMITAAHVVDNGIPAVTHKDGTARPQVVKKASNPRFYGLLEAFGSVTGHEVLLNTSLNIMGQPIIRTPDDAIRCFYATGMDYMVLGNYIISKGGQ